MGSGNLIFIMGDQLTKTLPPLVGADKGRDVIFMCEVRGEATAVKHHKKKIAFVFSAMRHFAQELTNDGYTVDYVKLDDPENTQTFAGEIKRAVARHTPATIQLTDPSEHRVRALVKAWHTDLDVPVEVSSDNRFLCDHAVFAAWAKDRKQLRMEYFYREMRRKYGVLMEGNDPVGGAWNFDKDNRKPPKEGLNIPPPFTVEPDDITIDAMKLVSAEFADHFGDMDPFHYAVTRAGALDVLTDFIENRLPRFGAYQDAMIEGEPWMFHSHISLYVNCGLLDPLECIKRAEDAYRAGDAPINAAEGFIRQILGWREYVKGLYDYLMPEYRDRNALGASRPLPGFYWDGNTQMNCVRNCVLETKQNAYAHHIQRLMVLGNFALLAGCDPAEVNDWYHLVYADAYEWVELPNVTGMVLYADGGVMASKPYAASGAYINKMSDYCGNCRYKVSKKNGPDACPFNYLYWHFIMENKNALKDNHRMRMTYTTLDRMSDEKKQAVKDDAARFFKQL